MASPSPPAKSFAPATQRNREPIAAVLRDILPASGTVLEIASGSGEHIVYFAELFPQLRWQPSDPDAQAIGSITAWSGEAGLVNVAAPVLLDAATNEWPVSRADAILCINMIHISPWVATRGLMHGAGRLLPAGAPLFLYGPFREAGVPTAPSNIAFDESLQSRDARWGLRLLDEVIAEARANDLVLERRVEMPANNLSLAFRRR